MKKEMNPVYRRYRWTYSNLSVDRQKDENNNLTYGDGYYRHKDGWCVRIYFDNGYNTRSASTTLDCNYNGYCYIKTYQCLFSDSGLSLICAKFIKQIICEELVFIEYK